ncbi:MAG TPA: hypothetical protein VHU18_04900 [Rhizomicrobium sp.]|jgi:hypothetical protein|nr:hypothetical protein [Rhizomicrobium sp.]
MAYLLTIGSGFTEAGSPAPVSLIPDIKSTDEALARIAALLSTGERYFSISDGHGNSLDDGAEISACLRGEKILMEDLRVVPAERNVSGH